MSFSRAFGAALALSIGFSAAIAESAPGRSQPPARAGAKAGKASPSPSRKNENPNTKQDKTKKGKQDKKKRKGSVAATEPPRHVASLPLLQRAIVCPDDMVAVAGRLCVDRYESTLVDAGSGELLSPYYPPAPKLAAQFFAMWSDARDKEDDGTLAKRMPLPLLPDHERAPFRPRAMSWPGGVPSGYTSGELAKEACEGAGKRLCTETEWVTACRGQGQTQYPYGARYQQGACNVFREDHPAHILHGAASVGLSDPRLNQIDLDGKPLLRATGATPACASRWGDDAIYDMVGNLDEWIDDPEGTFVGGFYARATRAGCDARIGAHPARYFDYSTGVRCCKDPDPATSP